MDRIVTGLVTEDIMEACKEQIGLTDVEDEAGASQAIQMLRALKNKNVAAVIIFLCLGYTCNHTLYFLIIVLF